MKVGDLVTMSYSNRSGSDEWGVGIIVESSEDIFNKFLVYWSKLETSSWERREMLVSVDENR